MSEADGAATLSLSDSFAGATYMLQGVNNLSVVGDDE